MAHNQRLSNPTKLRRLPMAAVEAAAAAVDIAVAVAIEKEEDAATEEEAITSTSTIELMLPPRLPQCLQPLQRSEAHAA